MPENPILTVHGLKKYFTVRSSLIKDHRAQLKAVDGVDLQVREGEALGLVGESGCGKSTLGKTIIRLYEPTGGTIEFKGQRIESLSGSKMRPIRKDLQIIFQNPYSSLNPRQTIFQAVKAPLKAFGLYTDPERNEKVEEMLDYVGLERGQMRKYPHEMSGGQRQRAVIARAMISGPELIICDEPVSALDASVRSQVLNLMRRLQRDRNISYIFISHDLSVVRYLCDRVAVMYLGRIVEYAEKRELFENPLHPYTKALLSAIPVPDVDAKTSRIILEGDVPSPLDPPSGCRFHTRCPEARPECAESEPELAEKTPNHSAACLFT